MRKRFPLYLWLTTCRCCSGDVYTEYWREWNIFNDIHKVLVISGLDSLCILDLDYQLERTRLLKWHYPIFLEDWMLPISMKKECTTFWRYMRARANFNSRRSVWHDTNGNKRLQQAGNLRYRPKKKLQPRIALQEQQAIPAAQKVVAYKASLKAVQYIEQRITKTHGSPVKLSRFLLSP